MSNRTADQASALAALKVSHEMQIEALTAPGLTEEERVRRFMMVVNENLIATAMLGVRVASLGFINLGISAAKSCWCFGELPDSIFAVLPAPYDCCPLHYNLYRSRGEFPVPESIPSDWNPTRQDLEAFARAQQQVRFGGADGD